MPSNIGNKGYVDFAGVYCQFVGVLGVVIGVLSAYLACLFPGF